MLRWQGFINCGVGNVTYTWIRGQRIFFKYDFIRIKMLNLKKVKTLCCLKAQLDRYTIFSLIMYQQYWCLLVWNNLNTCNSSASLTHNIVEFTHDCMSESGLSGLIYKISYQILILDPVHPHYSQRKQWYFNISCSSLSVPHQTTQHI